MIGKLAKRVRVASLARRAMQRYINLVTEHLVEKLELLRKEREDGSLEWIRMPRERKSFARPALSCTHVEIARK